MKKNQSNNCDANQKNSMDIKGQKQPIEKAEDPTKVVTRRIPQTLIQSYDLITLNNEKKKRRYNAAKGDSQQSIDESYYSQLKHISGECFYREDPKGEEQQSVYQLTPTVLAVSKICRIKIEFINKIKLIESENESDPNQRVIKLNWNQKQEESSSVAYIRINNSEDAYFLFSGIISRKLLLMDFILSQISSKAVGSKQSIKSIQGEILKLSYIFKNWQKRKVVLGESLESFKDSKCTFKIKSIKQVWTRFSMYNGYFIVKIHHGMEKTELGIPLVDFTNTGSTKNWLFLLAKLIK